MKSGRFHDQVKFSGFHGHEIRQISWNAADFMKSGRFHAKDLYTAYLACNNVYLYWFSWKIQHSVVEHEIWQIS